MPNLVAFLSIQQQGAQKSKNPLEALRPKLQVLSYSTSALSSREDEIYYYVRIFFQKLLISVL